MFDFKWYKWLLNSAIDIIKMCSKRCVISNITGDLSFQFLFAKLNEHQIFRTKTEIMKSDHTKITSR